MSVTEGKETGIAKTDNTGIPKSSLAVFSTGFTIKEKTKKKNATVIEHKTSNIGLCS